MRAAPLLGALLAADLMAGAAAAWSQEPRAPRWTIAAEAGAQLGATIYDEYVKLRLDTISRETNYREKVEPAFVGRLVLRYRPQASFGLYIAYQYSRAATEANYTGGNDGPQTFVRRLVVHAVEGGVSVLLGRWADGQGLFQYTFGPALVRHSLDLSAGHRDAYARLPGIPDTARFRWSDRSWASWGLALGASLRLPVGRRLALRLSAHDQVVPVATSELETQERNDVFRMTGRSPVFLFPAYTAHYASARLGVEYVLDWQKPRAAPPQVALPRPDAATPATPQALEAARAAAVGDTVGALDQLRKRVQDTPEDASAWRQLALLLARRAEADAQFGAEAWDALQRALRTNPGDEDVLSAYGRVRAIIQRGGRAIPAPRPLTLSPAAARADAAGVLSLSFAIHNLAAIEEDRARYRVQIDVSGPDGAPVQFDFVDERVADDAGDFTRTVPMTPSGAAALERLELRLTRARSGPHSVRIRVTDLTTAQATETTTGFEIR